MQGPTGTGKFDRERLGQNATDKQAPIARRAGANGDITPGQASGYALAMYSHAHSNGITLTYQISGV
jgi:hypothetical protein